MVDVSFERFTTLLVCCLSLLLSFATVFVYFKNRNGSPVLGMLVAHTFSCAQFSFVCFSIIALELLDFYFTNLTMTFLYQLYSVFDVSQNTVYVSGALLAVDRVVIMAQPVKYSIWNVSSKLAVFTSVAFFVNVATILTLQLLLGFSPFDVVLYLRDAYNGVFLLEILLHFVFLVQCKIYYKRSKANFHVKQQMHQTNQITLFQLISLLILGIFPKILYYLDWRLLDGAITIFLINWSTTVDAIDRAFFSLHVLLTSAFTLFKLKQKVTRSSGCGMAVERYITLPVSCINFLLLSATFLVYLRFHRVSSTVGILLSHILICLQYSIVCILCVAFEFLVVHEVILNTKLVHDLIAWTIQDASQNAVYLSGALLAVDRVLIMAFPVRYSFLKITKKLAAANFLLFFLNAAVVAVTLVLDQKDLRRLRAQLQDAYKIIFLAEIFLHFVFLVQTWRYSKRAANSQMKKKMMQTNQITLFQMGALLTVGLFPKVLYAVDHYFLHERLEDDLQIYWQANMYMVDRMFFSFHELLTAAFTLFKLSHNARVVLVSSRKSTLSSSRIK
ncbi:hypothetical protein QR680_008891 [Steinernema hermaphroditum]|uniref:Uncharacterized protein n=1 Tax=Steinernema hermaphroditum TaxID=289476 RepID=A0AA39IJP6_9BILA|nr:hypothetical protein QR680_008891 [Steinernema hermaphroditum]